MADDGTLPRVERRGRDRGRRRVLRHARWLVQGGGREDRQGPVAVQGRVGRGGIGRGAGRGRGEVSVGGGSLKKKKKEHDCECDDEMKAERDERDVLACCADKWY